MRNYSISTCGEAVHSLLKTACKTCVQASTAGCVNMDLGTAGSVKPQVIPKLFRRLLTWVSTPKYAISPLYEYIFYPVSTVPTIRATN